MRIAHLLAVAALVAGLPAAADAQTVVAVDGFNGIELHGGGTITIRPGPVQRVTLVRGDPAVVSFEVVDRGQGGKLIVSPCRGFCMGSHHLEVEIETPQVGAVSINGGGHILADGAFQPQGAVAAVIHGGGEIDLKEMPAQAASATIHGGGKIALAAQNSLSAQIYGGGAIRYVGQPTVSTSIHGGGTVRGLP